MEIKENYLFHGSLADIADQFLEPTKGKVYEGTPGDAHYEVYLTSNPAVAVAHMMGRLGGNGPIWIDGRYIFDHVNAPAFGYLYTTEIPNDLKHFPLFASSRQPVRILGKYALTPTTLARFLPTSVHVMRPGKWRRMTSAQLADRLRRTVERTKDPDDQNKKIKKLLDKYTYEI